MTRFLIQLSVLSFIVGIGIWSWNNYGPTDKHLNDLWFILGFFFFVTTIIHTILIRSSAKNSGAFIRAFMGTTMLKLFLYLFIIVGYRFLKPAGGVVFLMGFLVHYLVFTAFEVASILKYFKKP
jgi:hypothetical protein